MRSAARGSDQSPARPSRRRSSGPPRCSSTLRRLAPKPRAFNRRAMAAGLSPSLLRTSRRRPSWTCACSAASGRATSDRQATSCRAQPRRAAASEREEGAGRTRSSVAGSCRARLAPTPNSIGSPLASTQVGWPRRASNGSRENGVGQVSRAAPMHGGSSSSWRAAPTIRLACSRARRACLPRPG
ncbi:Uncharacterised protein [Acinetobacter baumannii]|nr:Uncharacterised protein [Acinetobacter baumannii]